MANIPLILLCLFSYIAFGGMALELIQENVPRSYLRASIITFSIIYLIGWVWLFFSAAAGSLKKGFLGLRYWLALIIGLTLATLPLALFPHPIAIFIGFSAGLSLGAFIATGKWETFL